MQKSIHCPKCSYEYLPGEIFVPEYFTGKPKDIERDENGKIIANYGINQETEEMFQCENCGCRFNVTASIAYNVSIDDKYSFDDDYKSAKYPTDRLNLFEG